MYENLYYIPLKKLHVLTGSHWVTCRERGGYNDSTSFKKKKLEK